MFACMCWEKGCGLEAQGGSIAGSHVRSAGLPLRGCFFTTNPRSSSCLNIAQASSPSSDVVGGRRRRMGAKDELDRNRF